MSRHYPAERNPFGEDEDSFGSRGRRGGGSTYRYDDDDEEEAVAELRQLQHRGKEVTKESLAGTQRIMGMIHESESVGIATAEELARQEEQLDNVERNLHKMNADMKETQRHINSLKSITGGIKNWFTDKKKKKPKKEKEEKSTAAIPESIENMRQNPGKSRRQEDHPAFRTRSDFDQDEEDRQIDRNLEEIADGTARLKELALGLGTMVDNSNRKISRIGEVSEDTDIKLKHQEKQVKKILQKK